MEDIKNTQGSVTPNEPTNEELKVGEEAKSQDESKGESKDKVLTQEQFNKSLSERLERQEKKLLSDFEKRLESAREEERKQAEMTAEEREKELQKKRELEMQSKETELAIRENKLEGIQALNEFKIPIDFVDFLVDEDKEVMQERVEAFIGKWKEGISEGIKNELKGETPTDPKKEEVRKQDPSVSFGF
jgi:acyl-CoA reductase-like NAD-dependent aldehyde dehydrogenase